MRVSLPGSIDHISEARRAAILAAWPVHVQMEAHAEAAAGRPEKLLQMLADISAIKAANPKPEGRRDAI